MALRRGSQKRLRMFVCRLKIEEISGVVTCFKEFKKKTDKNEKDSTILTIRQIDIHDTKTMPKDRLLP